jgi:hypothetical protein
MSLAAAASARPPTRGRFWPTGSLLLHQGIRPRRVMISDAPPKGSPAAARQSAPRPVAVVSALVTSDRTALVAEHHLTAEVLKIRVLNLPVAQHLVRKIVHVLENEQPGRRGWQPTAAIPDRGGGPIGMVS